MTAVDDMWTLLSLALTNLYFNFGEIWYKGPTNEHNYTSNFSEIWMPEFKNSDSDVTFFRGGFQEYEGVLRNIKKGIKIYYGAGRRYVPNTHVYDICFVDSKRQLMDVRSRFPKIKTEYLLKPCADTIFRPLSIKKKYDVCFVANGPQARFKGHDWLFTALQETDLSVLNCGIVNENIRQKYPFVTYTGHLKRQELVKYINQCKVGVVASTDVDSCPRVIPEFLACGLPIVVINTLDFWNEKYITPVTGILSKPGKFVKNIKHILNNYDLFKPAEYYNTYLNLNEAARWIYSKW